MKANEKLLVRFLESSDTNFIIPVYQRNYNWQKEHCERLYDDCINIIKNDYKSHFLGTIVSIYNESGRSREYLVIDGQQRIITISLMLLAIYNSLAPCDLREKILNYYLINPYIDDERKLKLQPIKDDKIAFERLFEKEYIEDSNITSNYMYFYNRLQKEEISIIELYSAIEKLMIVEIELKNGEDDPQLIFESLNSTGLYLNDGDKIRNFILMGENLKQQEYLYNTYWNKIEQNTLYKVSNFIRDYMTMKENKISNITKIYVNFKKYILENNIKIKSCLKDMVKFSKYYKVILSGYIGVNEIDNRIKSINKLEITVIYPFLLEVINDYYKNIIDKYQLIDILGIIESYIFRRIMCGVSTNTLNKVFMNLGKEIKKREDYKDKYVDILKYILINKKSKQRFPNDDEFRESFYSENIYSWKSKNKIYLLEKLENYKNNEKVDIENLIANKEITIEHIMPQKLNKSWREMLGHDFEEIHKKYLHTIGNLTLTGYNSSMSNRSFYEKRDMEKGFKYSRLKLNKYISFVDTWNEKAIIERTELLFEEALDIWKYPSTNYKEKLIVSNLYTLEDKDDFTNTKVSSFIFMGDEYKVKHWTELYEEVCSILYDNDPFTFEKIVNKNFLDEHIKRRFSNKKNNLRDGFKVSEKIYIEKNLSTEGKIATLRFIFDEYNINYDELMFFIK